MVMDHIMRDSERFPQSYINTPPDPALDDTVPAPASSLDASNDMSGTTLIPGGSSTTHNEDGDDGLQNNRQTDLQHETRLKVLLFASLKDAAKADHIEVHIPISPGATITVADLLAHCGLQYPQLAPWLPHVRVAVNCEYSDPHQLLTATDEIALLPPVSGGADGPAMPV
jgi:molybdopterin converting factor small subunit